MIHKKKKFTYDQIRSIVRKQKSVVNPDELQTSYNPFTLNFRRLQRYKPFFDLPEIVLFEYLLILHSSCKRDCAPFYKAQRLIALEARIKSDVQNRVFERFEKKLGIISTYYRRNELPQRTYYALHFEKIIPLLHKIYEVKEIKELVPFFRNLRADFDWEVVETDFIKKLN